MFCEHILSAACIEIAMYGKSVLQVIVCHFPACLLTSMHMCTWKLKEAEAIYFESVIVVQVAKSVQDSSEAGHTIYVWI